MSADAVEGVREAKGQESSLKSLPPLLARFEIDGVPLAGGTAELGAGIAALRSILTSRIWLPKIKPLYSNDGAPRFGTPGSEYGSK